MADEESSASTADSDSGADGGANGDSGADGGANRDAGADGDSGADGDANRDAGADGAPDANRDSGAAASPDAPTPEPPSPEAPAAESARYRKLHTLSGALALGVFLVEHIATNASALGGRATYDAVVGTIVRSSVLPFVEVVFILLPLAFHAGYGLYLLRAKAAPEAVVARYGDRRLWRLQRLSALFVLVFVLVHLWELRAQRLFFGLPADALHTTLTARLSSTWAGVPFVALFYVLGVFAVAVHLSNGLFAATAAWNLGVSPSGRRTARIATLALGGALFAAGAGAVVALATGTRLLPGADGDSAAVAVPCGSSAPPPFRVSPTPSR